VPGVEGVNGTPCPVPKTPVHEKLYGGVPPVGNAIKFTACDTVAGLGEAEQVVERAGGAPLTTLRYT
jgi:hypothetical protein